MVPIENLKLNELTQVEVPHARDLMKVTGYRLPTETSYSGEETIDPNLNKTDAAKQALTEAAAEAAVAEEE